MDGECIKHNTNVSSEFLSFKIITIQVFIITLTHPIPNVLFGLKLVIKQKMRLHVQNTACPVFLFADKSFIPALFPACS